MKSSLVKFLAIVSLIGPLAEPTLTTTESTDSSEIPTAASGPTNEPESTSTPVESETSISQEVASQTTTETTGAAATEASTEAPQVADTSEVQTSSTATSEEDEPRAAGEVNVTDWGALVKALQDTTTTAIHVKNDLRASSSPRVSKAVTVDFEGHQVDFASYSILLASSGKLALGNLVYRGTGVMVKGTELRGTTAGTLVLTGKFTSGANNSENIAAIPGGNLIFDGVDLVHQNLATAGYALDAKNFTITNGAKVQAAAHYFYHTGDVADNGGIVTIEKAAQVATYHDGGENELNGGQVWSSAHLKEFNVTGAGTSLYVKSSAAGDGKGADGAVVLGDDASGNASLKLNISDQGQVVIDSQHATGLYFNSSGGSINLTNGDLEITQEDDGAKGTSYNTALRLGLADNQKIKLYQTARLIVTKQGGSAPAARFSGATNEVRLYSGSDMIIQQLETTPAKTVDDMRGQALLMSSSAGYTINAFYMDGDDTNLAIKSAGGAAMYSTNAGKAYGKIMLRSDPGSYLTIAGKVATHPGSNRKEGVVESADSSVYVNDPKYYDIRNTNGTNGQLFIGGPQSILSSLDTSSDVAFWKNDRDIEGPASYNWSDTSYRFQGEKYPLIYTDNSEMAAVFKNTDLSKFSRIRTGNTMRSATVDAIYPPGDADGNLYIHAGIRQGKDEPLQDADPGEVQVTVTVQRPDGRQDQFTGIVGDTQDIYEDPRQNGWIKIPYQLDGQAALLPAGAVITVVTARLQNGTDANGAAKWSELPSDNITSPPQTVSDVTPPNRLSSNLTSVSPNTKEIVVTGTPGSLIFGKINGEPIDTIKGRIDAKGQAAVFLPPTLTLQTGDKLQLFASDTAGKSGVTHPPATNNDIGNINPEKDLAYHDAVFPAALTLEVTGALSLVSVPDLIFGDTAITGRAMTLRPDLNNQLVIADTRGGHHSVSLWVNLTAPLTVGGLPVPQALHYVDGNGHQLIGTDAVAIGHFTDFQEVTVSGDWNKETSAPKGFLLQLSPEEQRLGSFSGGLVWTLGDVPENG